MEHWLLVSQAEKACESIRAGFEDFNGATQHPKSALMGEILRHTLLGTRRAVDLDG